MFPAVMTNTIPGAPIREPPPMAINVAGYKLVYGSYNGTSEANIMGYWTSPLVGPDRGNIQSDIWKVGSATANIKSK
jgi:hypothetical protein